MDSPKNDELDVSPEMLAITPERAAAAQAELMAALGAIALAKSPEEAQEILDRARKLVPELWRVPEMAEVMKLGFGLGQRRAALGENQSVCVEPGCSKPIARTGARGKIPLRCEEHEAAHRRQQLTAAARNWRHKKKLELLTDAIENAPHAASDGDATAVIRDAIGQVTDGLSNGGDAAEIVAGVARRGK